MKGGVPPAVFVVCQAGARRSQRIKNGTYGTYGTYVLGFVAGIY